MTRAAALLAAAALLLPAAADARKPRVEPRACATRVPAKSVPHAASSRSGAAPASRRRRAAGAPATSVPRRCRGMGRRTLVPWLGPVAPTSPAGNPPPAGGAPHGGGGSDPGPSPPPPPPPPEDDPRHLQVRSGEFFLALSQPAVDAGEVTVEFNNEFAEDPHDLVIEGNGDVFGFDELGPGAVSEKVFGLERGDYALFCAIEDHAELGMQATLHVR